MLDPVGEVDGAGADDFLDEGTRNPVTAEGMLHVDPVENGRVGARFRDDIAEDLRRVVRVARDVADATRDQPLNELVLLSVVDSVGDACDRCRVAVRLEPRVVDEREVVRREGADLVEGIIAQRKLLQGNELSR